MIAFRGRALESRKTDIHMSKKRWQSVFMAMFLVLCEKLASASELSKCRRQDPTCRGEISHTGI